MKPIRILLIDDDEDDFVLTRDLLSESTFGKKYQLDWCYNYSEGINAIVKNLYDVFLVDYRLGKNTGIDILQEASLSNCDKPIILLTGKGDIHIDEEAMVLGAADYLFKDELTGSLLERIIRYNCERYKSFQKIKESENKFRLIFERSKDPMLITDITGKIFEVNTAAINFFESSKEVFLQQNAKSLYKHPSVRDVFTHTLQEKGSVTELDVELLTSKGEIKYCSISASLQFQQEEGTELYYSVIHDLTGRKLQEDQKMLENKLAAVGRIARNFAAEIYNPLSNVNLAIDELSLDNHNQEDVILLDMIKKNCIQINDLTSQLIESTQISSLKKKKVDVRDVIKRSVSEAEGLFNLDIEAFTPEDSIWLHADEESLNSVFISIFQNAADAIYARGGKVIVDVQQNTEVVTIDILDSGEGISEEDLDKIFEPFFTTKSRSSGLGLTYSQRIISAHDGKLSVNSKKDEGTKVSITLPA
jgi:PAS domain S-box-containing protein